MTLALLLLICMMWVPVGMFFLGYAFIPSRPVLWGLFILDNALFALGMAMTTYVRKIAPTSEHTPTLSMGVAMNHVAAVVVPLGGAFLWRYAGFRSAFLVGSAIAFVGVLVASRLPRSQPAPVGA